LTADQMRGIAKVANECGDGDIRLTVWQNLLISGVPQERLAEAEAAIAAQGSDGENAAEAYHIHVGGGFGPHAQCGREIYRDVQAEEAPAKIKRMQKPYPANRTGTKKSFAVSPPRHDIDALKPLFETQASECPIRRPRRCRP